MTQTCSGAALSRRTLLRSSLAAGIAVATPAIAPGSRAVAAPASPVAQVGAAERFAALDDLVTTQEGTPFPGGSGPLPLVAEDRGLFDFAGAP